MKHELRKIGLWREQLRITYERERDYGDDNANDGKNSGNNDNGAVTENACFFRIGNSEGSNKTTLIIATKVEKIKFHEWY